MQLRAPLFALLLLCSTACRATDPYQSLPLPSQEVEVSRPDLARIYVMRSGQTRGALRSLRVEEADKEIGALGQDEFLCWERAPGRTLLTLNYEGPVIDGGDVEGIHSLDAAPGAVYYLLVHLDTQPTATEAGTHAGHPQVEMLDAAVGREQVKARRSVPVR